LRLRGFSIHAVLQSRWAEALGAAGCAAFFVSLFALSLEWRLEQSRSLRLPELRVLIPFVGVRAPTWAMAPSEHQEVTQPAVQASRERAPIRRDLVASTQAAATRAEPSVSAPARSWMAKLTETLLRAKRLSWAGLAPGSRRPTAPALAHRAKPKAIRAKDRPVDTQPLVMTQAEAKPAPPSQEPKPRVSIQSAQAAVSPKALPDLRVVSKVSEPVAPPAPTPPLAVIASVIQEPALAPVPAPVPPKSAALQLSGWVVANTQLQFSTRPTRVTFTDVEGHTEEASVGSDGRVVTPAGSAGVLEYSFQAWLDRPTQRPAPVVVALAPSSQVDEKPTLAATFWSPDSIGERLDFRESALTELKLNGQVFEADATQAQSVAGAEVGLVGSPERVAITDSEGRFDLGTLRVAAGGRAFLEARRPDGFKHRFAVETSEVSAQRGQALFLFSEQQIAQWQSALEGGLSPQSGWIVGAFAHPEMSQELRPEITAPQAQSKVSPETYALGSENQLAPLGLNQSSARWLSVEIPSGAARVRLINPKGRTVRELWEPISPGVINVIRVDRER